MLTRNNYFNPDNEWEYFGSTQFKSFLKCEAAEMARLNGEYTPGTTTALLVGSYVDAYFEGRLNEFIAEHPEILNSRSGALKAEYKHANAIIERCGRDRTFSRFMSGEKQVIIAAELFGHPFKIRIDSYHPGKMIVDLKVMKDFEPVYVPGKGKLNFIEAFGYDIQGAIYQAVEQQARIDAGETDAEKLPFYLACATKQETPDIAIFEIPQYKLDAALKIVEHYIDEFAAVKDGEIYPKRCEHCEYCRATKRLKGPVILEDMQNE